MPAKTLVCAISLLLLNATRAIAFLAHEIDLEADEDPYFTSPDILELIHNTIIAVANSESESASPVIFMWTLVLHRMYLSYNERAEKRDALQFNKSVEAFEAGSIQHAGGRRNSAGSIVSLEALPLDLFLQSSGLNTDMQIVEQLAMSVTVQGRVYDVVSAMAMSAGQHPEGSFAILLSNRIRAVLLDFLKAGYPIVGYQADPVMSLISALSAGQQYWDVTTSKLGAKEDLLALTLSDDTLIEFYFEQALSRYPYEFLPFISLCKSLGSLVNLQDRSDLILSLLKKTPTLTFTLPDSFQDYELALEEENTNTFCIIKDLPLFSNISSRHRRSAIDDSFRIPAGTYGRFVTDSGRVVMMEYEHSGLALLGRRLEASLTQESYRVEVGPLQPDETAEVIALIAILLRAALSKAEELGSVGEGLSQPGLEILEELSKTLSGSRDILSVICDIMDISMQDNAIASDGPGIAKLSACIQFLHACLTLCPSRVWSYLARCELLGSDSRAGKLVKICGNLDLVNDRFDFLVSTVRFFSSAIESAMKSSVQRKGGSKLLTRQKGSSENWLGVADKVLARVSFAITQAAVDIFENSSTWRFSSELHQTILIRDVIPIMNGVISYAYRMGEQDGPENLTSCLKSAANYVVDCFLSPSSGSLRFQPLLATLIAAKQAPDSTLYPRRTQIFQDRVILVLEFATSLLRVAAYLERPSSLIESQIFKTSTLVSRLVAVDEHFKRPALLLLDALVVSAGKGANEPPSLLGYLGPHIAKSFIQILSRLDEPFFLIPEITTTWKFFSTILRNRQQWMATCLLTGLTPRDAQKGEGKQSEASADSVFSAAFTKLKSIKDLPPHEALAILDFVTSAQNFWPWTIFTMQKDPSFLDSLRSFVRGLKPASVTTRSSSVQAAYEARMAAYIAETFAMQLYHLRHMSKSQPFATHLINDLDYYLRDGVEVPGYNNSLHSNFSKNFANQYPGCILDNFKRTLLEPRELGSSYYYDLERANEMLSFDAGWIGRRGNGFKNEMEFANANLSLVDAQIVSTRLIFSFYLRLVDSYLRRSSMLGNFCYLSSVAVCRDMRDSPSRFFKSRSSV
jgi:nuclear pore complex protein Nup188